MKDRELAWQIQLTHTNSPQVLVKGMMKALSILFKTLNLRVCKIFNILQPVTISARLI